MKRGSWKPCAKLIASVMAKMIALFPKMGRKGWRHCCFSSHLGKKNPHFPFAGAVCAALRVIYLEKNKQFRKCSPENVVSQTNLKPGWNQMRNFMSDISSLLGQGAVLSLVTQSLSFFFAHLQWHTIKAWL